MYDFVHTPYAELKKVQTFEPEGWNEDIVETAGFVPLAVRFKQLEQNGYVAQFKSSDFDSQDMRDIWFNSAFEILPGDDLEEVEAKVRARNEFINAVRARKASQSDAPAPGDGETSPDEKKPATRASEDSGADNTPE